MSKLSLSLAGAAIGLAGLIAPTAPAMAQNSKVSEIIVYGTDPCPRSTDDEIVVCARKPETERYRIPERLRQGGSLQSRQSWAARARTFETVVHWHQQLLAGRPGGFTGCVNQVIKQAFQERGDQVSSDTTPRN